MGLRDARSSKEGWGACSASDEASIWGQTGCLWFQGWVGLGVRTLMQRWRHDPKTAGHYQRIAKSKNAVQMPESPWVWSGGAARAVGAESRSQNWG